MGLVLSTPDFTVMEFLPPIRSYACLSFAPSALDLAHLNLSLFVQGFVRMGLMLLVFGDI